MNVIANTYTVRIFLHSYLKRNTQKFGETKTSTKERKTTASETLLFSSYFWYACTERERQRENKRGIWSYLYKTGRKWCIRLALTNLYYNLYSNERTMYMCIRRSFTNEVWHEKMFYQLFVHFPFFSQYDKYHERGIVT